MQRDVLRALGSSPRTPRRTPQFAFRVGRIEVVRVMNLNAGEGAGRHNPISSAIGLAIALSVGSAPITGSDMFSDFFDEIRP